MSLDCGSWRTQKEPTHAQREHASPTQTKAWVEPAALLLRGNIPCNNNFKWNYEIEISKANTLIKQCGLASVNYQPTEAQSENSKHRVARKQQAKHRVKAIYQTSWLSHPRPKVPFLNEQYVYNPGTFTPWGGINLERLGAPHLSDSDTVASSIFIAASSLEFSSVILIKETSNLSLRVLQDDRANRVRRQREK